MKTKFAQTQQAKAYTKPKLSRHIVDLRARQNTHRHNARTLHTRQNRRSEPRLQVVFGVLKTATSNVVAQGREWLAVQQQNRASRQLEKALRKQSVKHDVSIISAEDILDRAESAVQDFSNTQSISRRRAWPKMPQLRMPHMRVSPRFQPVVSFFALGLLVLLPVYGLATTSRIAYSASASADQAAAGVSDLRQAATALQAMDVKRAAALFTQAGNQFASVRGSLSGVTGVALRVAQALPLVGPSIQDRSKLLDAASMFAEAGSSLTTVATADAGTPVERMNALEKALSEVSPSIQKAGKLLLEVDPQHVPEEQRDQFVAIQKAMPTLLSSLEQTRLALRLTHVLLGGDNQLKRYVVVLQNNDELRPTGGFISGVAFVDVRAGEIRRLDVPAGGAYDFKGSQLKQVQSPKPLWVVNPVWQMQDANYFADFPTSAKKIQWFFEQNSGGYSIDGVIALNPQVVKSMLQLTGDIVLPTGERVTADTVVQLLEDASVPDADRPKQLLADVTPLVMQKFLAVPESDWPKALQILFTGLSVRDIQVYAADAAVQAGIHELGWDGALRETEGDYLSIVRTNIGGAKTDAVIDQHADMQTVVQADGRVRARLTLRFDHKGVEGQGERGVMHHSFVRVFVPKGATLLNASGFDAQNMEQRYQLPPAGYTIDEDLTAVEGEVYVHDQSGTRVSQESAKTVFGNWVSVAPGESAEVVLEYISSPLVNIANGGYGAYSLTLQQQSGMRSWTMNQTVSFDPVYSVTKVFGAEANRSGYAWQGLIQGDHSWGAILQR